jgi:cold shock CspA family protein
MGKSQETFGKKEREKKRMKKRKDKASKRVDRKANSGKGEGFDSMIAYVDQYGNVTSTPPDPALREEIDASDIVIGVPKKEDIEVEPVHKGRVEFFDDSKGYGFIKETGSGEKYFVHISGTLEEIRENDKVHFELERGLKGMNAVRVKKLG